MGITRMRARPRSYSERFDDYISPEPNSGCWLFDGGADNGYGYCRIKFQGKQQYVHRFAYERHLGSIPAGLFVCHKCDVRCCVNPDHLFLGTHADNMADMDRKGRQSRGVKVHTAKLLPKQVLAIRRSTKSGRALGREYGVTQRTILDIFQQKSWKHL